jgi:hypothetical protein
MAVVGGAWKPQSHSAQSRIVCILKSSQMGVLYIGFVQSNLGVQYLYHPQNIVNAYRPMTFVCFFVSTNTNNVIINIVSPPLSLSQNG